MMKKVINNTNTSHYNFPLRSDFLIGYEKEIDTHIIENEIKQDVSTVLVAIVENL